MVSISRRALRILTLRTLRETFIWLTFNKGSRKDHKGFRKGREDQLHNSIVIYCAYCGKKISTTMAHKGNIKIPLILLQKILFPGKFRLGINVQFLINLMNILKHPYHPLSEIVCCFSGKNRNFAQ